MDLWVAFVTAMKKKYKQAVSELSHTQERHIVTTPTLPQLNLSLVWHQNSDELKIAEFSTKQPPALDSFEWA